MEIILNKPIFFMRDDAYSDMFCEIIEEQNGECCDNKIDEGYLSACYDTFTHGYMILSEPIVENQMFRGHQFFLKAFVLFEYKRERLNKSGIKQGIIRGKVICSSKQNRGLGKILLECVKEFARTHNVKRWIIHALAYNNLISYYRRFGFFQHRVDEFEDGSLKTVLMTMYLGQGIDFYNYDLDDGTCFEKPNLRKEFIPNDEENEDIFSSLYGDGL
jgi:GNAT superfamily N-acetyltransferase